MINNCLIFRQAGVSIYQKWLQIFDFGGSCAYNAAFSARNTLDESEERPMAGHSQFKNIMHRKGRQDAQKSKLFGKLAREITVAAKLGTPDPAMNPRLRAAVIAARQENMPKDNIERAVKKALGNEGENYDEIRYEGYGPGGVAVIVEALTDNRNRGFIAGSGVPSLAATVISRASLPNSFDFWASCLPLRCMMFLNCEWPAMLSVP